MWQKPLDSVPFVQEMTVGRSGVIVVGGPDITMVDPDGNVVATAPMPSYGQGKYDKIGSVRRTSTGGFDMLVLDDTDAVFLSEHGADLQQTQLIDTTVTIEDSSVFLANDSDSFILSQDRHNDLHLLTIEKTAVMSNQVVSLPAGSAYGIRDPATVAGDGTLLFGGEGHVGAVAGIAVLRIHADDVAATVLAVGLEGNEVHPIAMVPSGDEIIVVAADFDTRVTPSVDYLTAFALDSTGTHVVRSPIRVEQNAFHGALLDAQLVDGRVAMVQWDQDKFVLVSFDAETFAAYPTLELPIPEGDWPGPYAGHLATYDGVLYAVVTATNAGGWQTILQRLPPLDQAPQK